MCDETVRLNLVMRKELLITEITLKNDRALDYLL